ncbi:hypothetical protein SFRURICE_019660 [Spodoptera frugiperda]|nr:hypothetical protein SFRURICE_019660 [Spodoptera frugiperda]
MLRRSPRKKNPATAPIIQSKVTIGRDTSGGGDPETISGHVKCGSIDGRSTRIRPVLTGRRVPRTPQRARPSQMKPSKADAWSRAANCLAGYRGSGLKSRNRNGVFSLSSVARVTAENLATQCQGGISPVSQFNKVAFPTNMINNDLRSLDYIQKLDNKRC